MTSRAVRANRSERAAAEVTASRRNRGNAGSTVETVSHLEPRFTEPQLESHRQIYSFSISRNRRSPSLT